MYIFFCDMSNILSCHWVFPEEKLSAWWRWVWQTQTEDVCWVDGMIQKGSEIVWKGGGQVSILKHVENIRWNEGRETSAMQKRQIEI